MIRKHITIIGKVQGVLFRDFIRRKADELSVYGWVKNIGNYVEAVFEGEEESVKSLIEFCRKGPSSAQVKNVDVSDEDFKEEFDSFEVRY